MQVKWCAYILWSKSRRPTERPKSTPRIECTFLLLLLLLLLNLTQNAHTFRGVRKTPRWPHRIGVVWADMNGDFVFRSSLALNAVDGSWTHCAINKNEQYPYGLLLRWSWDTATALYCVRAKAKAVPQFRGANTRLKAVWGDICFCWFCALKPRTFVLLQTISAFLNRLRDHASLSHPRDAPNDACF